MIELVVHCTQWTLLFWNAMSFFYSTWFEYIHVSHCHSMIFNFGAWLRRQTFLFALARLPKHFVRCFNAIKHGITNFSRCSEVLNFESGLMWILKTLIFRLQKLSLPYRETFVNPASSHYTFVFVFILILCIF